jgi:hypothetical protein
MFDGPTTAGVDFGAPLVVVDLSAVYHSPALPVVMTCVAAWLQATLESDDGAKRMVVVDESWRMFSHLPIAAWMQQSFKLSRASGTMNVLVMHRLSDLASAGSAGSHQVRLAEGLLADTETRVIYGQPPSEVDQAKELLGLSDTEAKLLPQLPRGQALWKVGARSFLVEHRLSASELALVDTDARMQTASALISVQSRTLSPPHRGGDDCVVGGIRRGASLGNPKESFNDLEGQPVAVGRAEGDDLDFGTTLEPVGEGMAVDVDRGDHRDCGGEDLLHGVSKGGGGELHLPELVDDHHSVARQRPQRGERDCLEGTDVDAVLPDPRRTGQVDAG